MAGASRLDSNAACQSANVVPNVRLESGAPNAILGLAEAGYGIAVLPSMLRLTRKGLREVDELDRRSDAFAHALLAPLADPQRERLVGAMAEVERLMRASAVRIQSEPAGSADARWYRW